MSEQRAPQQNCPTSKRTATGTCGEGFIVHGVTHSCKLSDDHEGSHWCDCAASLPESQPSPSGDAADEIVQTLMPSMDREMFLRHTQKVAEIIRSHDANVSGQAEQRLRKALRELYDAHRPYIVRYAPDGMTAEECRRARKAEAEAEAALQESPSD